MAPAEILDCSVDHIRQKEMEKYQLKKDKTKVRISLSTFIRMNVRLDLLMDEIEEALASLTDEEVEKYYRKVRAIEWLHRTEHRGHVKIDTANLMNVCWIGTFDRMDPTAMLLLRLLPHPVWYYLIAALSDLQEFAALSHDEPLLSYSDLMAWSDLQDLISNGIVLQSQLDRLWTALPKQPLGKYFKPIKQSNEKDQAAMTSINQSDGITIDAFLMFNEAIEDIEGSEIL